MAGAAAELGEAILVNPSDISQVADAIYKALTMPGEEKKRRISSMTRRLIDYDVFSWANDIFRSTMKVKTDQDFYKVKLMNRSLEDDLIDSICRAERALLFFDYDGTLVPIRELPEMAIPDMHIISITERLTSLTNLVIISGRKRDFLDKWFSDLDLILIAEHGAFIKYPGSEWVRYYSDDDSWKETIRPVMIRYSSRCKGTFIEDKTASLSWHYRNADADLSSLRAIELKNELDGIITNLPLQVIDGHKVVEVKISGYNKGSAARRIVSSGGFDFVMAIGDDRTDEELFSALPEDAVTIKVGKGPSLAKYCFEKQSAVTAFLERLVSAKGLGQKRSSSTSE
jgi:trehalose 6-phosphate synthase/phosphatase